MTDLADRIRERIDKVNGGNVKDAALRMGLDPSTLLRIVTRRTKRPTTDALSKIADYYQTTIDWLVAGKGRAPPSPNHPYSAELFEWAAIVRSLELSPEHSKMMLNLPRATAAALYGVVVHTRRFAHPDAATVGDTPDMRNAVRLERAAWIQLFREWIRRSDIRLVRNQIEKHAQLFKTRFAGLPSSGDDA